MDYFLRRFSNTPFSVILIFYCGAWAFLCGVFAYLLILSQADFAATGTRNVFLFTFPLYLLIVEMQNLADHGALRIIGIKKTARKFLFLNKNIKGGHISPDISTETLKEVFYQLSVRYIDGAKIGLRGSVLVVLSSLVTEYIASGGMITNLFVIFISGVIVILMLTVFILFFVQYFISFSLKECRLLLRQRGEKIEEPSYRFNDMGTKLDLSLTIPIFAVLIISLAFKIDLNVLIFVLISLVMATLISKTLSSSISQAFLEVKDFARELPKGKKILFSTGSMDPSIIALSASLNKAAGKICITRKNVEQSKADLEKRVEELEKWYQATVDREIEMVKIKQEITELKTKLKE